MRLMRMMSLKSWFSKVYGLLCKILRKEKFYRLKTYGMA
jgi:hypothetical protein